MPQYDVSFYVVARVVRTHVQADSMKEAIANALNDTDFCSYLDTGKPGADGRCHYADEVLEAMVDVVGDEDHHQSRTFVPSAIGDAYRTWVPKSDGASSSRAWAKCWRATRHRCPIGGRGPDC